MRVMPLALLVSLGCGRTGLGEHEGRAEAPQVLVAVGSQGVALRSTDHGLSWTTSDTGVTVALESLAAGNGLFVAVGQAGTILTSHDGRAWSPRASGTTTPLLSVAFTGEKFVAVGGDWAGSVTLVSQDGLTWSTEPSVDNYMLHAVAVFGDRLVVAGQLRSDLLRPGTFASTVSGGSSPAGWSKVEGGPLFHHAIQLEDELVVSEDQAISTSRDGLTWTRHYLPGNITNVHGLAWNGSTFVASGRGFAASTDGIVWSVTPSSQFMLSVAWSGSHFVAVGEKGHIFRSADGASWSSVTSGASSTLIDVVSAR